MTGVVSMPALNMPNDIPLTFHEALSGIFASISLSSWTVFLVPQLLENRRNQSGDAVSLPFLLMRSVSDVCNLLGGTLAHIVPGLILIAAEYVVSDILLLTQILYYGIRNRRIEGKPTFDATVQGFTGHSEPVDENAVDETTGETSSLLREHLKRPVFKTSTSQYHYHALNDPVDHLTEILDERRSPSTTKLWFQDLRLVLVICVIATIGWTLAYQSGIWKPGPEETEMSNSQSSGSVQVVVAQTLGFVSAVLSLTCRLPQIWKNWRNKSCEGLSLLFFILSLVGNLTYGASILCHSLQKDYVMKNIPWLLGSLGTMAQDVIIFLQFRVYRKLGVEGRDGGS